MRMGEYMRVCVNVCAFVILDEYESFLFYVFF